MMYQKNPSETNVFTSSNELHFYIHVNTTDKEINKLRQQWKGNSLSQHFSQIIAFNTTSSNRSYKEGGVKMQAFFNRKMIANYHA